MQTRLHSALGAQVRVGATCPSVCGPRPSVAACHAQPLTPSAHIEPILLCPQQRAPSTNTVAAPQRSRVTVQSAATASVAVEQGPASGSSVRPLRVLIAGAGIGGLVLAVGLQKQGFDVQVFERDLTAIRGEGKYRGPIQVQSNALAALEAIDPEVAYDVFRQGCVTGDRINGLCDGLTGEWYVKFDTFHPAVDAGLPVTRVVSRVALQEILAKAVLKYGGPNAILNGAHVTEFQEYVDEATGLPQVRVNLQSGETYTGDLLVGADGIWSKIRKQLIGETKANYSGYTCYTGISDFTPADIDIVGYRVFLGNGQYFVSSDVGGGKMQWYGFHKEAPGGTDPEGQRKKRLLQIFGHWNDNVVDLIKATPEEDILRRDIFDRPPIFTWTQGRVALLGDSAHAMQPNLGQGGCMAIEDGYALAVDLGRALANAGGDVAKLDVPGVLRQYQDERLMRVSMIHGMAGMAAFMASTYKCYLGEGWPGWVPAEFSTWVQSLRIPHPGRVVGRVMMLLTMPMVLQWVLGGNTQNIVRTGYCTLSDKSKAFEESQWPVFMSDDEAITNAAQADWLLVSEREQSASSDAATTTSELKGIYLSSKPAVVGRVASTSCQLVIDDKAVAQRHAQVWTEGAAHYVQDLGSETGTWINGRRMAPREQAKLHPGDVLEFGAHPATEVYKVKLQHVTLRTDELSGLTYRRLQVGKRMPELVAAAAAQPFLEPLPAVLENLASAATGGSKAGDKASSYAAV